jgi:drug/metabolite transporter, DME family
MVLTPRISALACGSLAALTWGLTGTFIKLLPDFTTLEILTIRLLVALTAALSIFLIRRSLLQEFLTLIRQPSGLLLSSLMVFYYLFAVRAFQLAPVSDVVLIVGLSPIIGLGVNSLPYPKASK